MSSPQSGHAVTEVEHPTLEELRRIDLFDDLDEEQLALWRDVAVIKEVPADRG